MLMDGEVGNVEGMIDKVGDMLGEFVDFFDFINSLCLFKCLNGKREREWRMIRRKCKRLRERKNDK